MAYLLDTDVFIQAKNLHYGFDFCPAFWEWIEAEHATGTLFSILRTINRQSLNVFKTFECIGSKFVFMSFDMV